MARPTKRPSEKPMSRWKWQSGNSSVSSAEQRTTLKSAHTATLTRKKNYESNNIRYTNNGRRMGRL